MQDIKVGDKVRVVVDKLSLGAGYYIDGEYSYECKGMQLEVVRVGTYLDGVEYIECLGPGWAGIDFPQTILASDVELIKE